MKSLFEMLGDWLTLPVARGVDLDASEAVEVHRRIIQEKRFLHRLYEDFYHFFVEEAKAVSPLKGKLLELGSGGGFLKQVMPDVITSDISAGPQSDMSVDAESLPFASGELKAIFLLNVLHHIPHPRRFFQEADRCLIPGGRVILIEPFNSRIGRVIYQKFHHEPFDDQVAEWEQNPSGRLSTSNQAIPWIIFSRDREKFEKEFPRLKILRIRPHTPLRYVLSGGLSLRSLAPPFSFPFFSALDRWLSRFDRVFPMFQTIVIQKV